jgi:hypothetical protein
MPGRSVAETAEDPQELARLQGRELAAHDGEGDVDAD